MSFGLPDISNEQTEILNLLKSNNLIINSVAGSGKTTTNLYIAKTFPDSHILLLTYNKKLRLETRKKAADLKYGNISIHTYHSFCYRYFNSLCRNDSEMIKLLKTCNFTSPINFDMVLLDESQDIVPLYFELIQMILHAINPTHKTRICILGDKYQCIYKYNKADERYMTLADKIFYVPQPQKPWIRTQLSQSFRVTKPIAHFINRCMLTEERIRTIKEGPPVKYIIYNTFENYPDTERPDSPVFQILECIKNGYKFEDIFILAPSLKSAAAPSRILANNLTLLNIPIYVPNFEDDQLDESVLLNKIAFSTFHQAKGLERKVIMVYGFDNSYFKFFKKKENPLICPNELYVAVTRAMEVLILVHHDKNDFLPFLNIKELGNNCLRIGNRKQQSCLNSDVYQSRTGVTELVRHLPCDIIDKALSYVNFEEINHIEEFIEIPLIVKQNDIYYEDVSDINGVAIPAWFELHVSNSKNNIIQRTNPLFKMTNDPLRIEIPELLKRANLWNSYKSGYTFKMHQIREYQWLSEKNLEKCLKRLQQKIKINANFEVEIKLKGESELLYRELKGFIDCWDDNNVWEFKCVKELNAEHKLQLAIYMYLFETRLHIYKKTICKRRKIDENLRISQRRYKYGRWIAETHVKMNYFLMNILNNNILKLKSNLNSLRDMVRIIFEYKYGDKEQISNEEFLKRNPK